MRMTRSITALAAVAATLAATAATAADLGPYRGGSIKDGPAPIAYAPQYNWTGLYLGAQIGYGWGDTDASSGPITGFNQSYGYDSSGWVGGGHLGYNWQVQNLVFGIETDLEGSSIGGNGRGSLGLSHDTDIGWLGSTRGRLGIAYDRTLFYATAGLAYGDVKIDKGFASYSDVRTGWTVGGGMERAISDRMSLRLEYRYTDLGSSNFASTSANSVDKSSVEFHAVRAGLSFKF
jgi:outer membrane immunogenic protein